MKNLLTKLLFVSLLTTGTVFPIELTVLTEKKLEENPKDDIDWHYRAEMAGIIGLAVGTFLGLRLAKKYKLGGATGILRVKVVQMIGLGLAQAGIGAARGSEEASVKASKSIGYTLGVMEGSLVFFLYAVSKNQSKAPLEIILIPAAAVVAGAVDQKLQGRVGRLGHKGGAKARKLWLEKIGKRGKKEEHANE